MFAHTRERILPFCTKLCERPLRAPCVSIRGPPLRKPSPSLMYGQIVRVFVNNILPVKWPHAWRTWHSHHNYLLTTKSPASTHTLRARAPISYRARSVSASAGAADRWGASHLASSSIVIVGRRQLVWHIVCVREREMLCDNLDARSENIQTNFEEKIQCCVVYENPRQYRVSKLKQHRIYMRWINSRKSDANYCKSWINDELIQPYWIFIGIYSDKWKLY